MGALLRICPSRRWSGADSAHLLDEKLAYSLGFPGFLSHLKAAIDTVEESAWVPAIDADGQPRDGAWAAEITALLDLRDWPAGMRVVARKERAHPGAQQTLTDVDGHRVTCFATNGPSPGLPALEARHRQRARCEDRIKRAHGTYSHAPTGSPRKNQKPADINNPDEIVGLGAGGGKGQLGQSDPGLTHWQVGPYAQQALFPVIRSIS